VAHAGDSEKKTISKVASARESGVFMVQFTFRNWVA
jgi:hypothetical protein